MEDYGLTRMFPSEPGYRIGMDVILVEAVEA